jgi:hypothetical protein
MRSLPSYASFGLHLAIQQGKLSTMIFIFLIWVGLFVWVGFPCKQYGVNCSTVSHHISCHCHRFILHPVKKAYLLYCRWLFLAAAQAYILKQIYNHILYFFMIFIMNFAVKQLLWSLRCSLFNYILIHLIFGYVYFTLIINLS